MPTPLILSAFRLAFVLKRSFLFTTPALLFLCCFSFYAPCAAQMAGQLDLGIFNMVAASPAGNKVRVALRSNVPVSNGYYTEGKFTLRCPSALSVNFTVIQSDYGFEPFGAPQTSGGYTYYTFSNVLNAPFIVNWPANTDIDLVTLTYGCVGSAPIQLTNDAFAASIFGEYYQELDALDQTGIFYQTLALGPTAPGISAGSNTPVCAGTLLDLFSITSGGTPPLSYQWSGANGFVSGQADPAPFSAIAANTGNYQITLTDANACTTTAATSATVYTLPVATISGSTAILAGNSAILTIHFTGSGPWNYAINGVAQAPANNSPVSITVSPSSTTTYTLTSISDQYCSGVAGSQATVSVRSVQIDIGIFNETAAIPAGNKVKIKIRPAMPVVNGVYSEGKFTLRCPTSAALSLNVLQSDFGFQQFGSSIDYNGHTYFRFSNVLGGEYTVNWSANQEIDILTLGYACSAAGTVLEIVDDAYVASIFGEHYQELNAQEETGNIYQAQAASAPGLSVILNSNTPVCAGTLLDLGSSIAGGSGVPTFEWSGPAGYSASTADPAPFLASSTNAGFYTLSVTDANGCTVSEQTQVFIYPQPTAILNGTTTILTGTSTVLSIHFTGAAPWQYSINGVVQPPATSTPVQITVSPLSTTAYTITALSDALCSGITGSSATITVRSVLIDVGLFTEVAPAPAAQKLTVKIRPALQVVNGIYSEGKFTLRCPSAAGISFDVISSAFGFEQFGAPIDHAGFRYFRFSNVLSGEYTVNWMAGEEIEVLTLGYSCTAENIIFELIDDSYVSSIFGEHYQELNAQEETGNIYQAAASAQSAALSVTTSNNSPFCAGGLLDLQSSYAGGTGTLGFAWSGPDGFAATLADPAPFNTGNNSGGLYTLVVTDANGCSAAGSTLATVYASPTLSITQPAAVCLSLNLELVNKGEMPSGGAFSYHASLADAINNTLVLGGTQVTAAGAGVYGVRYTVGPNNCFAAASITVVTGNCVEVDSKIFLQGPYNTTTNTMDDALRLISTPPLFPLTEPYSQYNNAGFNFAFVHYGGGGGETILPAILANNDPNDAIVDWIFVELRHPADYTQIVATRAALLQRDGDVVDTDGISPVLFAQAAPGLYFLAIRHRNHLGVMTAAPVNFSMGMPFTDFTTATTATFGATPTSARRELEPGVWGLWAGNTNLKENNLNFQIKYNGSQNDRVKILNLVGPATPLAVVNGYYLEDVNLNGQVKYNGSQNDRVIILNNVGPSTPLNIITQEPPN
jgi:hypothetical protein